MRVHCSTTRYKFSVSVKVSSQYIFDKMKHTTSLLQLALPLLVSVFLSQAAADCEVEWDKHNLVATQLEGSWVPNEELNQVINPSGKSGLRDFNQIK